MDEVGVRLPVGPLGRKSITVRFSHHISNYFNKGSNDPSSVYNDERDRVGFIRIKQQNGRAHEEKEVIQETVLRQLAVLIKTPRSKSDEGSNNRKNFKSVHFTSITDYILVRRRAIIEPASTPHETIEIETCYSIAHERRGNASSASAETCVQKTGAVSASGGVEALSRLFDVCGRYRSTHRTCAPSLERVCNKKRFRTRCRAMDTTRRHAHTMGILRNDTSRVTARGDFRSLCLHELQPSYRHFAVSVAPLGRR